MKTKLLLLCAFVFMAFSLNAKETTCYKKNWTSPATLQNALLDGGDCASKNSLNTMQEQGWRVKDIQIKNAPDGFDYTYVLTDVKPVESKYVNLKKEVKIPSFGTVYTKLNTVTQETARIDIANLKIGQSGIVTHTYPNNKSVIVANAHVIETNDKYSVVSLEKFDDLTQKAIPETSRKAQNDDTLILNYLYEASLLIAPTSQSFAVVTEKFKNHKFLHSDIFATHLKLENEPLPSKETFVKFAKFQNIGTIFFVVSNRVFVLDAKTFSVLHAYDIMYSNAQEQLPFYTRVAEIDKAFWDIDFQKYIEIIKNLVSINEKTEQEYLTEELNSNNEEKTEQVNYNAYYENLLGLK